MGKVDTDAIMQADFQRWLDREGLTLKDGMIIYPESRAGLDTYEQDRQALKGIGMVSSHEVRYSERWKPSKRTRIERAEHRGVIIHKNGTREVRLAPASNKTRALINSLPSIHV